MFARFFRGYCDESDVLEKISAGIQIRLGHSCVLETTKHEFSLFLKSLQCQRMFVRRSCGNHCFEVHLKWETWLMCVILSPSLSCFFIFIPSSEKKFHFSFVNMQCILVFDQCEAPFPLTHRGEFSLVLWDLGHNNILSSLWLDMLSKVRTRLWSSKILPSNFPLQENISLIGYISSDLPLKRTKSNYWIYWIWIIELLNYWIWFSLYACSSTFLPIINKFSFWWVFGKMVTLIDPCCSLETPQARHPLSHFPVLDGAPLWSLTFMQRGSSGIAKTPGREGNASHPSAQTGSWVYQYMKGSLDVEGRKQWELGA